MRYTVLGAVALLVGAAVAAGDRGGPAADAWPMYGGSPDRNLSNPRAAGLPDRFGVEEGKHQNVRWAAKLGGTALGGPVVAGGKVFIGTNRPHGGNEDEDRGVVMCLRADDGKFLWQSVHDTIKDGTGAQSYGVVSVPYLDGDRLYYVSNRWEVVCASAAGDGEKAKILWKIDMVKEFKVHPGGLAGGLSVCSPLVLDDLVFVVTGNGVDKDREGKAPDHPAPGFVALHKATGKTAWASDLSSRGLLDGEWGNPAAAKVDGRWQVIFPGGDGWLYAFAAQSGELLWKFDCNPKKSVFKAGGRGDRNYIVSTPVVWDNKVYVATGRQPDDGNGEGHLWCIDLTKTPKNKDKDLSPVNDNFDPKAEANKDSGLVWHVGGRVMPRPAGRGREYVFGRTVSTVAIHDGLLYAAELAGYLDCFDARTGQKYWEHDLKSGVWASPFYADGKVYLGTEDGSLFVLAHGKERKQLAKVDMDGALKGPVVAVGNVLYVSNGNNLFAIATEKR